MKLNKPHYHIFKNGLYALEGLWEITKNEKSFRIEIVFFFFMGSFAWILPIDFAYSAILFVSLFLPLMCELGNSAIERVVDLVTEDYVLLAKHAKDAGAAAVLLSLIVTGLTWVFTLLVAFKFV